MKWIIRYTDSEGNGWIVNPLRSRQAAIKIKQLLARRRVKVALLSITPATPA